MIMMTTVNPQSISTNNQLMQLFALQFSLYYSSGKDIIMF